MPPPPDDAWPPQPQLTEKDEPAEDRLDGTAAADEVSLTNPPPAPPSSCTDCELQFESEIVPVCPLAVAVELLKLTLPKSASGSG
jgi:hypothetical protein